MKQVLLLLLVTLLLIISGKIYGQTSPDKGKAAADTSSSMNTSKEYSEASVPLNPPPVSPSDSEDHFIYDPEVLNSWAILFFALAILLILVFAKPLQRLPPGTHMKLIVIGIVVFSALFLISAGFNSNQNAPAFGILGAIIGYILGNQNSPDKNKDAPH